MTEEQRPLFGYKSKAHEQVEFENPNEGKTSLNDVDDYVFSLKSMPKVLPFNQVKKLKDGSEKTISVDKAIVEWEEEKTKNVVVSFFRVDSLNFSDEDTFESGVVRFFKKIKLPLPEGRDVDDWSKHFIVGMRFRGRVAVKTNQDRDGNTITKYYLDVPTCRPIQSSDKHPEAIESSAQNAAASAATLANAKFVAKGAKTYSEAEDMLKKASATKEMLLAIFQAELDGKMTYPI